MPFTAAKRMRQYRKRLKENEEVYEEKKGEDRQRKATKRSQMTKSQLRKNTERQTK